MKTDIRSKEPIYPQSRQDFGIALICALQKESDAVEALLDGHWQDRGVNIRKAPGVCGGAPFTQTGDEIMLGDVIISTSVVQFDFRRQYPDTFKRKDTIDDNLGRPTAEIRSFLHKIKGREGQKRLRKSTYTYTQDLLMKDGFQKSRYPGIEEDRLYRTDYPHKHQQAEDCQICEQWQKPVDPVCETARLLPCAQLGCDDSKLITRQRPKIIHQIDSGNYSDDDINHTGTAMFTTAPRPIIHFGCVASGDTVMRSELERENMACQENVIAFEMEGAGVWDHIPTVIIKGVCDYADSHKNKVWQDYAAVTAAACMKAFINEWPVPENQFNMAERSNQGTPECAPQEQFFYFSRKRAILNPEREFSPSPSRFSAPAVQQLEWAAQKFEKSLTRSEISEFQSTTTQRLYEAMELIQKQHESVRNLQGMTMLQPFLEAMDQYRKATEVHIDTSPNLRFIWGPMKFLLQRTSTYDEAFGLLRETYHKIGNIVLETLESFRNQRTDLNARKKLRHIYEAILEFHTTALKFFRKRVWKVLYPAHKRTLQRDFEKVREQIEQHCNSIAGDTSSFNEDNQRDKHRVDMLMTILRQKEKIPTDRKVGFSNQLLRSWFDHDHCTVPQLWMTGNPGAGKTILASLIIEEARKKEGAAVAFFFCKHGDPQRNTFLAVTKGILSQLLIQNHDLLPYFYEKFSTTGEATLTSKSLAEALLKTSLNDFDLVYLVIDGLDECKREERKEITKWFQDIVDSTPDNEANRIRCIFVSQDDGAATKDFSTLPCIRLTQDDNKQDIEIFSTSWACDIQKKMHISNEKRGEIISLITENAKGMFLYAALVTSNLFEQASLAALEYELRPDRFPREIYEAYDRIVSRINENGSTLVRDEAFRLLGWLTCAPRPLKWYEVQGAVSTDFENEEVNWEQRQLHIDAKDLCCSLVEISADQTIDLVHKTAQTYLKEKQINVANEELRLALLCLGYLNLPGCNLGTSESELQDLIQKGHYSFLEYAVVYWANHLENVAVHSNEAKSPIPDNLAETVEVFLGNHWIQSNVQVQPSSTILKKIDPFQKYDFFEKLSWAIITLKKERNSYGKISSRPATLDLFQVLDRVRTGLEALVKKTMHGSSELSSRLVRFYGANSYKCERPSCLFFHVGFLKEHERHRHIQEHQRPFQCTFVEEGCDFANIGFNTEKRLKEHLRDFHKAKRDRNDEDDFPPQENQSNVGGIKFACSYEGCDKVFTQKQNMKTHLQRHINGDKKPWACENENCLAQFTKFSDLTRHLSTHGSATLHICEGQLQNGSKWGCGRKFPRADALKRHHNSKKGRECIRLMEGQGKGGRIGGEGLEGERAGLAPIDESRIGGLFSHYRFWENLIPRTRVPLSDSRQNR